MEKVQIQRSSADVKPAHTSCAKANGRTPATSQSVTRNRLLAALSPDDFALVQPHLVQADLDRGYILEAPDKRIMDCYFIERGLVSVIAIGAQQRRLEVGIVGCEGMTGGRRSFG